VDLRNPEAQRLFEEVRQAHDAFTKAQKRYDLAREATRVAWAPTDRAARLRMEKDCQRALHRYFAAAKEFAEYVRNCRSTDTERPARGRSSKGARLK